VTPPYLRAFWRRAYRENITGLAGMVAYNLLLALFPFALLVLFIFGQVIKSPEVEADVLRDLQSLFPSVEQDTLNRALNRVSDNSTTIGVAAALGALWVGTSFWGAMDTAFCRIYHVECRGWVEQKRFALGMLVVVVLFLAATVVIPATETLLVSPTGDLPFGLDQIQSFAQLLVLAGALALVFTVTCTIYYFVPKGHMPWRAVWPGALFLTVTAALANWLFPFYLVEVASVDDVGGAIGFVLVALIWFYLLALAILAGAVINALRHELHDTGTLSEGWRAIRPDEPAGEPDPG
jgi:YihY family inner membrane protein